MSNITFFQLSGSPSPKKIRLGSTIRVLSRDEKERLKQQQVPGNLNQVTLFIGREYQFTSSIYVHMTNYLFPQQSRTSSKLNKEDRKIMRKRIINYFLYALLTINLI